MVRAGKESSLSRFTLSHPQRPMFESRPYRQSPARREHIYGKVRPMEQPRSIWRKLKEWLS